MSVSSVMQEWLQMFITTEEAKAKKELKDMREETTKLIAFAKKLLAEVMTLMKTVEAEKPGSVDGHDNQPPIATIMEDVSQLLGGMQYLIQQICHPHTPPQQPKVKKPEHPAVVPANNKIIQFDIKAP